MLLTSTVRAAGLDVALSQALAPWRAQLARHDPAKVLIDLALTLALGGGTCSDLAAVRAEPAVFGPVASDPTLSRTIAQLAGDVDKVLAAINTARATARSRVWAAAGSNAPDHARDAVHPLVIDLDATLLTAHGSRLTAHGSRRAAERGAPTFKRAFGFHPCARSSTTGSTGPVSPWRSCCGRATPARTPPPTT